MVSILTPSHFPSQSQLPLPSPTDPPRPPHAPLHPFRTPSDPSSPSNRQFKASQVTALRFLPPPVPVRSLLAPAVQSSPPPRASTGDVHQSSSVDAGEAVGLAAAAAVGEFSPSSSFHVIRNCCSPGGGFFVNEQDGAI